MINTAYELENAICQAINGKRFKQINGNLKTMLNYLFGEIGPLDKIGCRLTDNYIKPDLILTYKRKETYVSVKNGRATVLHGENIEAFVGFLESIGISKETRETILYYQYGDGTLDGSGSDRMNYHEVYNWLIERIKKANKELNDRVDTLEKVVDRVMFQGVDITAQPAEFIYYGDVDFGITISRRQIYTYLRRKSWHFYDNLHIGPVLLRAHARYSNRAILSDERRSKVTCYWANLGADLEYIGKRYAF